MKDHVAGLTSIFVSRPHAEVSHDPQPAGAIQDQYPIEQRVGAPALVVIDDGIDVSVTHRKVEYVATESAPPQVVDGAIPDAGDRLGPEDVVADRVVVGCPRQGEWAAWR